MGCVAVFQVSVAEVDHQDVWQRSALGVALVGAEVRVIEEAADHIERFVWQAVDTEILQIQRNWCDDA